MASLFRNKYHGSYVELYTIPTNEALEKRGLGVLGYNVEITDDATNSLSLGDNTSVIDVKTYGLNSPK